MNELSNHDHSRFMTRTCLLYTSLPGGIAVKKSYDKLIFFSKTEGAAEKRKFRAVFTYFPFKKGEKIPEKSYTKWFDYDKIKNGAALRTRHPGDFLQVLQSGGTKKLKDYFIEEKIPRDQRDSRLLLADGNHIIWVVGGRISDCLLYTSYIPACCSAEKQCILPLWM